MNPASESPKGDGIKKAIGYLAAGIVLPFALVGALVAGLFARPIVRTPDEVARYIRAMMDGTVNDGASGLDYDEFSCVPIEDPQLDAIATRACAAFEQGHGEVLAGLLDEALSLANN